MSILMTKIIIPLMHHLLNQAARQRRYNEYFLSNVHQRWNTRNEVMSIMDMFPN